MDIHKQSNILHDTNANRRNTTYFQNIRVQKNASILIF